MGGFSQKRSGDIANAVFSLSDWFKAKGIERPDQFMELLALIVIAEDQTPTPAEIKHGQELAAKYGWTRKEP